MKRIVGLALVLSVALLMQSPVSSQSAAEPRLKPLMSTPGKLLFSADMKKPLSKDWRIGKGKWEIADGALRGAELTSDMHGAVVRHELPYDNIMVEFAFKLDGAKTISLSLNKSKGHLSRVRITANSIAVQKDDQDGKKGDDKAVVLDTRKTNITPGEWHTVLVELVGPEIVASLDGKTVAFGKHESIAGAKANFGLTVAGESASFKDLRIWEAMPSPSWPSIREKLPQK